MAAIFPPALKRPGAEATDQKLGLRVCGISVGLELGWDGPSLLYDLVTDVWLLERVQSLMHGLLR